MKFMLGIVMLMYVIAYVIAVFADNKCSSEISGYRIVKGSVYPFTVGKGKACFFAFYTANPNPMADTKGNGNLGDALWYGYYKINNPSKIYEFPKPLSGSSWSNVCSIEAISFYPMHGGKKRDVTVIGTCDKQNAINYTFPFVFIWQGDKYVLDEEVYNNIFGCISLTVADIRAYIKSPDTCYKILKNRYNMHDEGKVTCD